jgi:hypothetical protein
MFFDDDLSLPSQPVVSQYLLLHQYLTHRILLTLIAFALLVSLLPLLAHHGKCSIPSSGFGLLGNFKI